MKHISFLALLGLLSITACQANTINLATGLDASGNLQTTGGSLDANWTITGGNNHYGTASQAYVVDSSDADWYGGWEANGPNSSWIASDPFNNNNGDMTFTRTFNLAASQLSGASFTGLGVSVDDNGYVTLNGHTEVSGLNYQQAGSLTHFNINPADLVAGTNTLVMVEDQSDNNLEGGRFEGNLTINAVPAPSGLIVAAFGLGAFFLKRRAN